MTATKKTANPAALEPAMTAIETLNETLDLSAFARAAALKLSVDDSTYAGTARRVIICGGSNEEALSELKARHPEFPNRKHSYYARWYRAQLVMLGVISADFAAEFSR